MKRKISIVAALCFLFSLAILAACSSQDETPQPKTEVTAEDVKNEAAEAMETAGNYTMAQKEAYMQEIDARLEELDREIGALGDKVQAGTNEMEAEGRARLEAGMQALETQKETAVQQYEKLKASSGAAWNELKAGMDAAMDELNAAYDKARAEFE